MTPASLRIRVYYAKTEILRYTGNLDIHKLWERTLRRAGLPLAYRQGFHPQPKLNQACPLPLGMTSSSEVIDVWLDAEIPIATINDKLCRAAPPGIQVQRIERVDLDMPSLPTQILSAEYAVLFLDSVDSNALEEKIQTLLASKEIHRNRRGKNYDLRPLIEELQILPSDETGHCRLSMRLSARNNATGRPEEVILALGLDPVTARIYRTELLLSH
jgi:radical SAM-linked protein